MKTHEEICNAVEDIASRFPIKKVSYFGSYAENRQTDKSDLDLLLEFKSPAISLLMLSEIKNELEDRLKIPVDVIHAPLTRDTFIKIKKMVHIYG